VLNNDVIDWSNSNQSKYYIFYTHVYNQWQIEFDWACRDLNKTYFSSETIATQALEKFKERLYILLDIPTPTNTDNDNAFLMED
jgi:hypothetical protein